MISSSSFPDSVIPDEVSAFSARAHDWWDKKGAYAALHRICPLRLSYLDNRVEQLSSVFQQNKQWEDLRFLDVGCGGGLITEEIAKKGSNITGLDASEATIKIAQQHAEQSLLSPDNLTYQATTLENFVETLDKPVDVILLFELFEHITHRDRFVDCLDRALKPGGLIIGATINRTHRSFLEAIVAAEYLLGWVPAGTHDWDHFIKPSELAALFDAQKISLCDITGMNFNLVKRGFSLQKYKTDVNYLFTFQKAFT